MSSFFNLRIIAETYPRRLIGGSVPFQWYDDLQSRPGPWSDLRSRHKAARTVKS